MGQSLLMVLTHRIRQQAGSHRSQVWNTGLCLNPNPVGAVRGYEGRERGVSVTFDGADPPHSPASRLPQILGLDTGLCLNPNPVGAVRGYEGRERGVSVTFDGADPPHSPASRLPQVLGLDTGLCLNPNPVGAVRGYEGRECGGSVTVDGADPPHSPASRLPQVLGLDTGLCINPNPACRSRPRLRGPRMRSFSAPVHSGPACLGRSRGPGR